MEFLMRDDVNLSAEQWQSIDSAVIQAARNVLLDVNFYRFTVLWVPVHKV